MSDADVLSSAEIDAAGIADWRQLAGPIRARFRTDGFAAGLAFVTRIGAAAVEAEVVPGIAVTGTDVIVTLGRLGVESVTEHDIALARTISTIAAESGLSADPAGVMQAEFALDATSSKRARTFYAALLGTELDHGSHSSGDLVDPTGQVNPLWWQLPKETSRFPLPESHVPQQWHPDFWVAHDEVEHRIAAALAAGGSLVSEAAAPSYWVLEDPDGNRCCLCAPMVGGDE